MWPQPITIRYAHLNLLMAFSLNVDFLASQTHRSYSRISAKRNELFKILQLTSIEIVSDIKNFLPEDRVGVARMSETLCDVENLLRLGWTSSAASRPR